MCSDVRYIDKRVRHTEVPDKESRSPFLYYQSEGLEARVLAKQRQYCLLFMSPGTVRRETGIITVGHHPCLPSVYLTSPDITAHDEISQAFPLHICIL